MNYLLTILLKIGFLVAIFYLWKNSHQLKNIFKKTITFYSNVSQDLTAKSIQKDSTYLHLAKPLVNQSPITSTNQEKPEAFAIPTNEVKGIDVSRYQGDLIKYISPNDTLSFVIAKATEGSTLTDRMFSHNWKYIKEKGFIRGAYHFYHTKSSPEKQARFYINTLREIEKYDLPPILDIEEDSMQNSNTIPVVKLQNDLLIWLEIVENDFKRTPIIYTNKRVYKLLLADNRFKKYPLWIADYVSEYDPGIDWTLWQKMDSVEMYNHQVSYSTYNGTIKDLEYFITDTSVIDTETN